jgi:hypothetical protein
MKAALAANINEGRGSESEINFPLFYGKIFIFTYFFSASLGYSFSFYFALG